MKLVDFLKQYAHSIDPAFIDDFYGMYDPSSKSNFIINLEKVAKWLMTRKTDLKETLVNSYVENVDFIVIKAPPLKKAGGALKKDVFLTPKCFKLLAMSSKTAKAKDVRLFYFELEELVNQYKDFIVIGLNNKIKMLEQNQKPKCSEIGGFIYVVKASDDLNLVKIGKTTNLKKRMENYTSDKGSDIIPLLKYKVNNIDAIETCIKAFAKKHQYRKRKEIYKIDQTFLDKVIKKCIKTGKDIEKLEITGSNLSRLSVHKENSSEENLFLLLYRC